MRVLFGIVSLIRHKYLIDVLLGKDQRTNTIKVCVHERLDCVSGGALPLIFCIHVHFQTYLLGGYLHEKMIIR